MSVSVSVCRAEVCAGRAEVEEKEGRQRRSHTRPTQARVDTRKESSLPPLPPSQSCSTPEGVPPSKAVQVTMPVYGSATARSTGGSSSCGLQRPLSAHRDFLGNPSDIAGGVSPRLHHRLGTSPGQKDASKHNSTQEQDPGTPRTRHGGAPWHGWLCHKGSPEPQPALGRPSFSAITDGSQCQGDFRLQPRVLKIPHKIPLRSPQDPPKIPPKIPRRSFTRSPQEPPKIPPRSP